MCSLTGTVLGAIALEGFYTVFDRANKQVMFAESTCGFVDETATKPYIVGNIPYTGKTQGLLCPPCGCWG